MALSASRYLAACLGCALLLLSIVGGLNYAVDPYGVYHYGKSWDWIHHRSGISHFLYAHKAHVVEDMKPDTVILGNSRVLYGLDPHYSALPGKTYNLGLEGSNIYIEWRYLQHVAAFHLPQMVILGLDFQMFGQWNEFPSEFLEDRLSVDAEGQSQPLSRFADVGSTLFSTTALYYSMKSLTGASLPNFAFDRGFDADAMLKLNRLDLARNVDAANHQFLRAANDPSQRRPADPQQMEAFGKIVSFCAAHQIRLIVFIQPLHASLTDMLTADWNAYSAWMKELVATMESGIRGQNDLWDFTGYEDVTTESFPGPSDTISHMQYYWECSHYQKKIGDMVLSRILTTTASDNFGHTVNSANLQEDLDRIEAERDAWHSQGKAVAVLKNATPIVPSP